MDYRAETNTSIVTVGCNELDRDKYDKPSLKEKRFSVD